MREPVVISWGEVRLMQDLAERKIRELESANLPGKVGQASDALGELDSLKSIRDRLARITINGYGIEVKFA